MQELNSLFCPFTVAPPASLYADEATALGRIKKENLQRKQKRLWRSRRIKKATAHPTEGYTATDSFPQTDSAV